jgi:protein gp37
MSKATLIQWCDSTVNPVMGCAGCELWNESRRQCYAGKLHQFRKSNKGFSPDFLKPRLFPGRTSEAAGWADLTGTDRPDKPWLNGLPRVFLSPTWGTP